MTEEQVTKALLRCLTDNGWHIVCYDFPQSGTGRILHPNKAEGERNKGSLLPDIVAVKNDLSLFFENKDRFYLPDYKKVNELIVDNRYTKAIDNLLSDFKVERILYGIGLPTEKHKEKSKNSAHLVNFIFGVNPDWSIELLYNPKKIFL